MQNETSFDTPKRLKNIATTLNLNLPIYASQNKQIFEQGNNPCIDEADFQDLVFAPDNEFWPKDWNWQQN